MRIDEFGVRIFSGRVFVSPRSRPFITDFSAQPIKGVRRPLFSQTVRSLCIFVGRIIVFCSLIAFAVQILIPHMYQNPAAALLQTQGAGASAPDEAKRKWDEDFEEFYEEVFQELSEYGEIEEMHVCDNLGDHLVGNVYVKYRDEEEAEKCQAALKGRFYAGNLLVPEYSPVTEFREARCRQFDEGTCGRGAYCNFMHIKKVPRSLVRDLMDEQQERLRDRCVRVTHLSLAVSPAFMHL